jgi:hypothetical protein
VGYRFRFGWPNKLFSKISYSFGSNDGGKLRIRVARFLRNLLPRPQSPTSESQTWDDLEVSAAKSNLVKYFGQLNAEFQFEPLDIDPKALPEPILEKARTKSQKIGSNEKTANPKITKIPPTNAKLKNSSSAQTSEKSAGDLRSEKQ